MSDTDRRAPTVGTAVAVGSTRAEEVGAGEAVAAGSVAVTR
jgi:hypothetical protein